MQLLAERKQQRSSSSSAQCGSGGSAAEAPWPLLLDELAHCSSTSALIVPIKAWVDKLPPDVLVEYSSGLPAGAWNALAAQLREALQRASRTRGGQLMGEEPDLEEVEQQYQELLEAIEVAGGKLCSPLLRHLLSGSNSEAAVTFRKQVMAVFGSNDSDQGSDTSGSCEAEQLTTLLGNRVQHVSRLAADAPGGESPGSGGSTIHIFSRASSADGPGGLGSSLGRQSAGAGASLARVLGMQVPFRIRLWQEVCSTHQHPPTDRVQLVRMLAALRKGDILVVPSPCRLARYGVHLQAVLAYTDSIGVPVLAVAVGSTPAPTGLVVLSSGGQLGSGAASAEMLHLISNTRAAVSAAGVGAWALSTQHGVYAAQHAMMQRFAVNTVPSSHPVCRMLQRMLEGRQLCFFSRTSDVERHGCAQACAGAAASGTLTNGSISRQLGFLADICGSQATAPLHLQLNGASVASSAADSHPLLQQLQEGKLDSVVVVASSLDRLSRSQGTLRQLISAAKSKNSHIVTLLQPDAIMSALEQAGYVLGAVGADLHATLAGTPTGRQVLEELEVHASRNHALVRPAASSMQVLMPVCLTSCAPVVLEAALTAEALAADFAGGRQASFSDAVHSSAAAARDVGVSAYLTEVPANAGGQRGASLEQRQAAVLGLMTAAQAQLGGALPAGFSVSLGGSSSSDASNSNQRNWSCGTCSCNAGSPDLACRCRCSKCRKARESMCSCPAACDRGGKCTCDAACSCSCLSCHKAGGIDTNGEKQPGPCQLCATMCARPYQAFCSEKCYERFCREEGIELRRCPKGDSCVAATSGGLPGLLPSGFSFGQQHCRACANAVKNAKQNASRAAQRASEAGSGGQAKKRKTSKPRMEWTAEQIEVVLRAAEKQMEVVLRAAEDVQAPNTKICWKAAKESPVFTTPPSSPDLSGAWKRLCRWALERSPPHQHLHARVLRVLETLPTPGTSKQR